MVQNIFVHFFQWIMINSLHLLNMHQIINRTKMTLYNFHLEVIDTLLPPLPAEPMHTPPRINTLHRLVKNEELDAKGSRK